MADETGRINPKRTGREDRVEFVERTNDTTESTVFIGAPDFKVYVWGADISHDVFSVQITQRMDEGLSTCSISLVNDREKWTFPTSAALSTFANEPMVTMRDNLFGPGREGTNTQSDSGLITPRRFAKIKRNNARKALTRGDSGNLGQSGRALLESFQNNQNYPFLPGAPLIQMNDPIRVFLKNPWSLQPRSLVDENGALLEGEVIQTRKKHILGVDGELQSTQATGEPITTQEEEWFFGFTGYVATVSEDFDAESDRSIIRLFCEDIRRLLRYMRTTTNVSLFNINIPNEDLYGDHLTPTEVFSKLSNDTILIRGTSAIQAGMKLVSVDKNNPNGFMDYMLFGDTQDSLKDLGLTRRNEGMPVVTGVLGFRPENKQIKLIDGSLGGGLEAQMTDFLNEMYPSLSLEDVERFGADWSLGADLPTVRALQVDQNKFYVIMPAQALFAQGTVTKESAFRWPVEYAFRISYIAEFRSRLDIMNEFIKKLDCIWHTTPKGDIVLEFPQYDFIPHAYEPPWRSVFTIQNGFERFTRTEDDRNIKTLTVAVGSAIPMVNTSDNQPYLAYHKHINFELAARFGIREQLDNRPFMYSEEFINSSLPALASMWQELANSDAYRIEGLTTLPNFRAPIARPYYFRFRNVVAFANEIHHTVVWNQVAQTTYGLKYVRHYDPQINNWRKLSGEYGWFWGRPDKQSTVNATGSGAEKQVYSQNRPFDDMAATELKELLDDIRQRETITGNAIMTAEEETRLESILTELENPNTPLDDRKVLLQEFNDIVGIISTRQ